MGPEKQYAYQIVYENLKNKIIDESYRLHEQLPSKRQLSIEFNVSINTIEHALNELVEEGYIEAIQRKGCFVIYQKDRLFEGQSTLTPTIQIQETLPSQNRAMAKKTLVQAMKKVLNEHEDLLYQKCDPTGYEPLKIELVQYLKRSRNINVSKEQIIIFSTSEESYRAIVQMFSNQISIGIEDPCYKAIEDTYTSLGANIVKLPLQQDGIDLSKLSTKIDLLHLTPYHSYPSGVCCSISKRFEYAQFAKQHDIFLVEDDFDSEFASAKFYEPLFSLVQDRVIYLNTFSHTVAHAMRINYMILPKQLLKTFYEKCPMHTNGVSIYLQMVLAELLASQTFERHINKIRRKSSK